MFSWISMKTHHSYKYTTPFSMSQLFPSQPHSLPPPTHSSFYFFSPQRKLKKKYLPQSIPMEDPRKQLKKKKKKKKEERGRGEKEKRETSVNFREKREFSKGKLEKPRPERSRLQPWHLRSPHALGKGRKGQPIICSHALLSTLHRQRPSAGTSEAASC